MSEVGTTAFTVLGGAAEELSALGTLGCNTGEEVRVMAGRAASGGV